MKGDDSEIEFPPVMADKLFCDVRSQRIFQALHLNLPTVRPKRESRAGGLDEFATGCLLSSITRWDPATISMTGDENKMYFSNLVPHIAY